MKIKFTLDDDLPLNKTLEPYNKYYLQVFLDECLHELYMFKRFTLAELTFLKLLILIRSTNQKSALFITIGIFR